MQRIALIVAGGSGSRMNALLPKQFMVIAQKPILIHTLLAFKEAEPQIHVVLVLPKNYTNFWQELCQEYHFHLPHQVVAGGATRIESVRNGLEALSHLNKDALVAIHDSVRPLVSTATIQQSFSLAQQYGSAIACIPLKDSIRHYDSSLQSQALDRSQFRLVQTPQTFQLDILRKAYQMPDIQYLTDDASVVEKAGFAVCLFEGEYQNIKITTPEDLLIAEVLLAQKKPYAL